MTARLADGATIVLRPLRRGELDVLDGVFAGLSSRSRQQRYLVATDRMTTYARTRLAQVDGRNHVAWVALAEGRPVGICRYVRTSVTTAELAMEVVDAAQRRGVGAALLDSVTTAAYVNGVEWLEAVVDPGNDASVALLQRVGVRFVHQDGVLMGRGRLRLIGKPRVNRQAVLALALRDAGEVGGARPTGAIRDAVV